jgi:RNA polymerase sigma-70 factor (ECF subfamily)
MDDIEQIWQMYRGKLQRFIQNRVDDPATADDILQEVLIKIYTRLDTLEDDRRLRSWIYQITRNAITDYYRTHRTMTELQETFSVPELDATARARQEIGGCLLPIIERLPAHYRQAVMLSEIEGLKQREVAIKQGISLCGAKSRVQRGRKMLKEMLMAGCHFEFDHRGTVIDYQEKGQYRNGEC